MKKMKGKTNKQLLKAGLSHFEIMELLQTYLLELQEDNGEIESISEIDTSYNIILEVVDHTGRQHTFEIYLDEDSSDIEYGDKIYYSTQTAKSREDAWYGYKAEPYQNKKEFSSISATYNNFVRVLGL